MSLKLRPEQNHAFSEKVYAISKLMIQNETIVEKYIINAAQEAITKAEKAIKDAAYGIDTDEHAFAIDVANKVIKRAKEQDEELEKLRAEMEEKADHKLLSYFGGKIGIDEYEKKVIDRCRDYGEELLDMLSDVDGGALADKLVAGNPILRKYKEDITDQEFLDSLLAWGLKKGT